MCLFLLRDNAHIMQKHVLVTGATSGIGMQTALELLRLGYRVTIAGRNAEKLETALTAMRAEIPEAMLDGVYGDLSSREGVHQMTSQFRAKYTRLDVLINNAGAAFANLELSPDGIEMTVATNHLSYFITTLNLLDILKATPDARIVNVSSELHYQGNLDWDDLQLRSKYSLIKSYSNSKLMNVMFTRELADRLAGTSITVNCLHPGVVRTNLGGKHSNGFIRAGWTFFTAIGGISEKSGARNSVYVATSPELQGVTGNYYKNRKARKPSWIALEKNLCVRLWQQSEEWAGLKPEV